MGLDLMLYKRKEWEAYEKANAWIFEDSLDQSYLDAIHLAKEDIHKAKDDKVHHPEEICYGRKTWSLYSYFKNKSDTIDLGYENYEITLKSYLEFCETLLPFKPYISHFLKTPYDNYTELDHKTAQYIYKLIDDGDPQLEYIWDVCAFGRWVDKLPEIEKIYEDGDSLVMVASY